MTSLINEDELIERRLIFEGDSGMDDRRFHQMLSYIAEESATPVQQIDSTLDIMILAFEKCDNVIKANEKDQEACDLLADQMEQAIRESEERYRRLVDCDLKEAKQVLANRREYEVLERQLEKLPSREVMDKKTKALENKLEKRKKRLESKTDVKTYCKLASLALIHTAEQLQLAIGQAGVGPFLTTNSKKERNANNNDEESMP